MMRFIVICSLSTYLWKFGSLLCDYLTHKVNRLGSQYPVVAYFILRQTHQVFLNIVLYNFHTGLFTENCFVLAEGFYEDEVFHVSAFGFPPAEPARTTR